MKTHYQDVVIKNLNEQFNYTNAMQVPKLDKIVINMGLGDAVSDSKKADIAIDALGLIAGQKPVFTKAKKSIANFKLREGMVIGTKVTLRKARMYEFIDRLITIALPRVRDFRGISSKSFDGHGNYAMGIKEHIVFPEINYDKVDVIRGMDIIICTTANTDEEAKVLLEGFNFPLQELIIGVYMSKVSITERNNKRWKMNKSFHQKEIN